MSHLGDAPTLKLDNYEKWRNNMMLHLEAISDEMVTVVNDGPIKIEVSSSSYPRANDATANQEENNECVVVRKPKDRSEWTSEEAKRFRLDGQARNIIIRSTPHSIQCKLWGAKTAKEAWKMVQDLCAGSEKTKENKLEVLKLRFQTSIKVLLSLSKNWISDLLP